MLTIRPVCWPDDAALLAELDTSFTTDRIYRVVGGELGYSLVEEQVEPPLSKNYGSPMESDDGSLPTMDYAAVAVDGGVAAGVAGATFEAWTGRMVIPHVYVGPNCRGKGVGRNLINQIEIFARSVGARCLWLDTQNINYPAIQFYRRVGFRFCGLDESLYDTAESGRDEVALFFVRELSDRQVGFPVSR